MNPLSDAQVAAKFRDCAAFGLKPMTTSAADAFAATLGKLDESPDLGAALSGVHG
jgi:hypothetical protein